MLKLIVRSMGLSLLPVWILGAHAQSTPPVSICADPDPPPWTYWVRDAKGEKTSAYTGFSVDLFGGVFKKLGREVRFVGDVPWSRCLKMVEAGEIDYAMDAYFNTDREKLFAFSRHYNTLTPQVFFRAQSTVKIQKMADLPYYRGCGMLGASYAHYGLKSEQLDLGVNTYQALIAKLKAQRCDYFVEELEVIAGYKKLGIDHLGDKNLRYNAVTDAQAPAKHLIAARGSAAAALLPDIDKQLGTLMNNGEAARLWKKHGGTHPYKP